MKLLVTAIVLALGSQPALAEDLLQVYALAQKNDPQLAAARASRDATFEARPLAKSQLLPSVSASADGTWQDQRIFGSDSLSQLSNSGQYSSLGAGVNVVQPLYRRDRLKRLDQADSQVAKAEADYVSAEQALALRVAQAYFDVLGAQDNLGFAQSERTAIERQLDQAKQRFEVGLIAITGVHEAQARFDQSRADEIVAQNDLDDAWEALREIAGPDAVTQLAHLKPLVPLDPPAPAEIDEWSQTALQNNPAVQSAMEAAEAARKEIEVQRSGNYPTVDLVGGYQLARSDASRSVDANTASIGIQLAMPLYTGGGVAAATRQAQYNFEAAQETLDQQRRAVDKEVRNAYRGVTASIEGVKALEASMVSAQSALDATMAGFDVGTRTMVDVLNAQRDLYGAKRNHARARYLYVLNLLTLEQAAGTLDVEDLQRVNAWLE